jgi:RNA polymerase sigma-70 factor (ECF subfamily)
VTAIELRPEGAESARLFEIHAPRLLAYCVRRLGSRSDAEDAVQTVFLQAHRALRRGVVPQSEEAWLLAIAKNVCRWQQRTAARRSTVGDLDPDAFASHRDESETDEIQRDLEAALTAVTERQREALLLREWRGLSCPEIAEVLELSPPATHALLTRARRSVANALAAAGRRPVLGLNFPTLVSQLRAAFAGTAGKAAATAVAVAGLGVGGVAVERAVATHDEHPAVEAPSAAHSSSAAVARVPGGGVVRRQRIASPRLRDARRNASPEGTRPGMHAGAATARLDTQPTLTDALPPGSGEAPQAPGHEETTPVAAQPPPVTSSPQLPIDVPLPPAPDPGSILDIPTVPAPPLPDATVPSVEVPTVPTPTVPSVPVTNPVTGLLP